MADAGQAGGIERQVGQGDRRGCRVDHAVQRVADHRRVLVQFLFHEMAEIALADRPRRKGRFA